ncbi:hypothetical protein [Ligilactobacillus acidipiscis]|uniref:Replication terminator protein, phage associated n=1 Tax=Ligilactobacillus acidipiscis TaxID=89059 RepID=A0A0R2KLL2_9LACO|nr:hypothetical protein [Ligilactobacillus acidipiscis]KRN88172.1 replication terminator protein, phage associated [Ligilactobacillus acidipiscis]
MRFTNDIDFDLNSLGDGKFRRHIEREVSKIFENIHDKQTSSETKRTMTIKVDFTPNDERETVAVNFSVASKLAPIIDANTSMKTERLGDLIKAHELKSGVPGQTYIDDDGTVKTDIGEPVDVVEKETVKKSNVIDMKAKG